MNELPATPTGPPVDFPDLSTLWGSPIQAAHCPQCGVAHLIPATMQTALCPACFEARLETQPTINRPEPPEMLIDFKISPTQVKAGFQTWLKGVWLRPKELQPEVLSQRLTRTFIPMWLVDGTVTGTWQAEMGYDYQVESSQEIYRSGTWTTRKLTETRIRWEPRTGTAKRTYQNLSVPALEEHTRLIKGLGKFTLESASKYSPEPLNTASVRIPSLLPDEAWPLAKSNFDRLVAQDCQMAANAQHVDDVNIQADYQDLNWTQLLMPVYTTAYRDENGKVYPILIHGQTGNIFGIKRASQVQARIWSLSLVVVALICFILGLSFAAATTLLPLFGVFSLLLFGAAFLVGITAPLPAFWAWNFNRSKDGE